MFEKRYGLCSILGETEFEAIGKNGYNTLIEYREFIKNTGRSRTPIIIGKDMITGTSLRSLPWNTSPGTLEEAAEMKAIKKDCLIVNYYSNISRKEIIDILKGMSKEDVETYAARINGLKEMYAEAAKNQRISVQEVKLTTKYQKDKIKEEKERLSSLIENTRSR
jgi:hypothetical protein